MKAALVFALLFLFTLTAYSQIEYPRYDKDANGQAIVMLTIEQAQALDNNTDLLFMFEKLNSQIGNYDSICLKLVNEKEKVIY